MNKIQDVKQVLQISAFSNSVKCLDISSVGCLAFSSRLHYLWLC